MNYMDDENDSIYFQQYENIYEYGGYGPWISYCLMQWNLYILRFGLYNDNFYFL